MGLRWTTTPHNQAPCVTITSGWQVLPCFFSSLAKRRDFTESSQDRCRRCPALCLWLSAPDLRGFPSGWLYLKQYSVQSWKVPQSSSQILLDLCYKNVVNIPELCVVFVAWPQRGGVQRVYFCLELHGGLPAISVVQAFNGRWGA